MGDCPMEGQSRVKLHLFSSLGPVAVSPAPAAGLLTASKATVSTSHTLHSLRNLPMEVGLRAIEAAWLTIYPTDQLTVPTWPADGRKALASSQRTYCSGRSPTGGTLLCFFCGAGLVPAMSAVLDLLFVCARCIDIRVGSVRRRKRRLPLKTATRRPDRLGSAKPYAWGSRAC